MANKRFTQMKNQIAKKLDQELSAKVIHLMDQEYTKLCTETTDIPADFVKHTRNNIFPVVATYRALMQSGFSQEEAQSLAETSFLELMEEIAEMIRKCLKVPGLYRSMPWLWKTLMPKLFSKEAGFEFKFYETDNHQVKFDMCKCPYLEMCEQLHCPELAPLFCATDDTCYGNMHPNLKWNRTKTMARGADLCDFDVEVVKK